MKNSKCMFLSCILALLVLPLVGAVSDASAQNILVNPGFETGDLTGWEVNGANSSASVSVQSPDNGPTLPGTNNAFMENFGEAIGLNLKQVTPPNSAAPGTIYYAYDLKLDQADVGGVVFVEIFAEKTGVGIVGGSGLMGPLFPFNAWTAYSGSFNAPIGTDFLTIQFVAATGAASGTNCVVHVDNVHLESESAVANESMSMGSIKALFR